MIELIEDDLYYILKSSTSSLWCSKIDGSFSIHNSDDIMMATNPVCLGIIQAVIGKFRMGSDGDWKLLLVKKAQEIGTLPPRNSRCLKVAQILVLTLTPDAHFPKDQELEPCPKHRTRNANIISGNFGAMKKPLQKKWNQFVIAAENIKPKKLANKLSPLSQMISGVAGNIPNTFQKDLREKEKFEKRVMEELQRMFNDADSFYFTLDNGDLTNSIQVMQAKIDADSQRNTASWRLADDCFFWNKHMLHDLIKLSDHNKMADEWIVPIIQGYVQIEECPITFEDDEDLTVLPDNSLMLKMCIISRRSRYRAGTRYRRRGIDSDGHTANFVETEQIIEFVSHVVSFTQIRGSIPLYWSQSGIKYRPPPKIEKDFDQNQKAFVKHMNNVMAKYGGDIKIISLIDKDGKEKVIGDVLLQHVIAFNHPCITYVTFDFHDYCQGMKFENVGILTENVLNIIQDMKYCWVDKNGVICKQQGIFRVNCIDCLDRTNIVQSALARIVLEMQFRKLGLLSPERQLSGNYKSLYQQMWANNGDAISRQYAGTAALKGDYTRTGERKFTGMMKDGVNSANRYFINQVKDVYRQATLDLLQGYVAAWDLLDGSKVDVEEGSDLGYQKEEDIQNIIGDCKKLLILDSENCLGGWGLVNCERLAENMANDICNEMSQAVDVDVVLLLSENFIYVAHYDDSIDSITSYQKIALDLVTYIELGLTSLAPKLYQLCLRIHYSSCQKHGTVAYPGEKNLHFYTFCLPGAKLLNAGTGSFKNAGEITENLMLISGEIASACRAKKNLVKIEENMIDCQMKSKPHQGLVMIASHAQKMVDSNLFESHKLNVAVPANLSSDPLIIKTLSIDHSPPLTSYICPSLENTISEHVQKTRKLQSELKELLHVSLTRYDHVCLSTCGIIAIRSKKQLKLGLMREAEILQCSNVSNLMETTFLSQFSENKAGTVGANYDKLSFLKKSSMVYKQNKSRSLDSTGMLQRVRQAGLRPKCALLNMSVLSEEEEKMCAGADLLTQDSNMTAGVPNAEDRALAKSLLNVDEDKKITKEDSFAPMTSLGEQNSLAIDHNLHVYNQMKNSKSENSFMDGSSSFELLSDADFDFLEQPTSSTSLSKLKRKFIQLALLPHQIGAPQAIQERQEMEFEQMRNQAKSNAIRSRLRFQYVKSQIILL